MNKRLYQRVCDIYAGAIGHPFDEENDLLGAEELARVIEALSNTFDPQGKQPLRFALWNIKEFENPQKATEHLEYLIKILSE